jgi:formate dehydrogenase subunit gamma
MRRFALIGLALVLAGPVFAVALLIFIFTYLRDNLPRADDLKWLSRAGGMFGGEEVPSNSD